MGQTEQPGTQEETEGAESCTCLRLLLAPGGREDAALDERVEAIRQHLALDLGLSLPAIAIDSGEGEGWRLELDGVFVARGKQHPSSPGWEGELERGLRLATARAMGVQECQDLLDRLEQSQPALVREVVPRLVPPVLLAEVLARLLEEGIPIRPLRVILSALAEWARSEADPCILAERVRERMRDLISQRLAPQGQVDALLLDPALEKRMEKALEVGQQGMQIHLSPEEVAGIHSGLEACLRDLDGRGAVVLTRPDLRRAFWRLASERWRELKVVSFLELEPEVQVRPLGRICAQLA